MAVPELSTPITRAVALVLKNRTRTYAANGATYAATNATFALAPAGPYAAGLGSFTQVPYVLITPTVTGLTTGSYRARGVTPGQADQPWGAPTAVTTGTPQAFPAVPVLVGNGASIVVAPAGLESVVVWRSATFNVLPAMTMSSSAGVNTLILNLKITVNNAAAANISVDWGDGTAAQVNTVAFWINAAGNNHTYTRTGSYTIAATATTAVPGPAGVSMLVVPVNAAVLTATTDPTIPYRVHGKIVVSASVTWTDAILSWGDGNSQSVLVANAADIPHDYATPGTYAITCTLNTGDFARGTATAVGGAIVLADAGDDTTPGDGPQPEIPPDAPPDPDPEPPPPDPEPEAPAAEAKSNGSKAKPKARAAAISAPKRKASRR